MLESTDAHDANEAIENAEHDDAMDPIDANEPIDPIENDDPVDAIEQNESVDHSERPVRLTSVAERVGRQLGAEALVVTRAEVR
jgi:hypothetical protein